MLIIKIYYFISIVLPTLIGVAFYTVLEWKLIAALQWRVGPDLVGFEGFLQAIVDGVKLFFKEVILLKRSDWFLFFLSPILIFVISLVLCFFIPITRDYIYFDWDGSLFLIFMISTLNTYSLILAGWTCNSVYAFLGSIWAISQLLAYEIVFGIILLILCLGTGTLNVFEILYFQQKLNFSLGWLFLPCVFIFYITLLAETNWIPFDLPEAEAELVAGYNVEYSGFIFALFFLGEYCNMLTMSCLFITFFFGNGLFFMFILKVLLVAMSFVVVWALLPWYWFDQLLELGWVIFIPLLLGLFYFYLFIFFNIGLLSFLNVSFLV